MIALPRSRVPFAVQNRPPRDPMVALRLSLGLGSYVAALFAMIPLTFLILRIGVEERLLQRQWPGYSDYVTSVGYRLVPGVW